MEFTGRTALVTGSSRGIGRGIALALAAAGAKVCVTYATQADAAADVLHKIREAGADGFTAQCDVCQPDCIEALFARVKQEFGHLDMFVSNARGELGSFYEPVDAIGLDKFEHAFQSQSRAFHLCAREAQALMRDGGRIIAITYAPSARTGSWQPWAAMGAAKAALESLCRYYAVHLGKRGITCNIVSPGVTDDSVVSRLPEPVFREIVAWHESGWTPMGRLSTPADIGDAVVLLCSDRAGFITGQTLYVDGGQSIMDPSLPLPIQWPR